MRERIIRIFAGLMILISVLLAVFVSPNWMFLTAFIGLNLLQSGFTKFCIMDTVLKKYLKIN